MRIVHYAKDFSIEKDIAETEQCGFLLTNKSGGFFAGGIQSRYRGWHCRIDGVLFKIIDDIGLGFGIDEIHNHVWKATLDAKGVTASFFLPVSSNACIVEADKSHPFTFLLDVKKPYDNRVWGRHYRIVESSPSHVLVEFVKATDSREDSTHGQEESRLYIAFFAPDAAWNVAGEWQKVHYPFDEERKSHPYDRHVYLPLKAQAAKLVLAVAKDPSLALEQAKKTYEKSQKLMDFHKEYCFTGRANSKKHVPSLARMAQICASHALDSLVENVEDPFIIAGLPWFFQEWSRDELISLRALMISKEYSTARKIIERAFARVLPDGNLPNRIPPTSTTSADAIGWLFVRAKDFIDAVKADGYYRTAFHPGQEEQLVEQMKDIVQRLVTSSTREGWAMNEPQGTWMDTSAYGDSRTGIRIEIQALRLALYRIVAELTGEEVYKKLEESLAKQVKKYFWDGTLLADGLGDHTIRPNVFMAAYIYPELLSGEEWESCFDAVLPKLWLEWGGISSIDTDHPHMNWQCTGEDSASYHHGDSWYFLNNMAAIVLHRVNKKKYANYIKKIQEASTKEILYMGFVGCHSEVSSAGQLKSEGCWSQAWSNALFIELFEEIHKHE